MRPDIPNSTTIVRLQTGTPKFEIDVREVVPATLVGLVLWLFLRADGGFYQRSWNMAQVVFLLAALSLVLLRGLPLTRSEAAFVGGLAAFAGWTAISGLWSESLPSTIEELQRNAVYPAAVLALFLARPPVRVVATGVIGAIVAAGGWALLQRLAPDVFGSGVVPFDHRLSEPVAYSNGLGLLVAVGVLLAFGLAFEARRTWARATAAALLVPLVVALAFTFSRGAWIALGFGLVVALAASPWRLRLVVGAAALAVPVGIAVWICLSSRPLSVGAPTTALRHDGHRALLALAVLAIVAAGAAVAVGRLHPAVSARVRLVATVGLAVAPVAVMFGLAISHGGPAAVLDRTAASFSAQAPAARDTQRPIADPRTRLLKATGSGRLPLWRVAWRDVVAHPLLGSGAGTYAIRWARERPSILLVQDAHSLYLETLAELGPAGLLLLLATLAVPLVVGIRRRHEPLSAVLLGGYAAYLAHAAIDWDWELSALTVVGLFCGAALLLPRGERPSAPAANVRLALAAPLLALLGLAFVGLIGSVALEKAEQAADRGDWAGAAATARRAVHWSPWQSEAWRLLGHAQLATRDRSEAAASFRDGLRRDPNDWRLWAALASVTSGAEHAHARERIRELNPRAI